MARIGGILWGLLLAAPSVANDSAFGGDASTLFPLTESRVRMVSENITLTVHPDKAGTLWRWNVKALYVFLNQSSEPLTLQVGFPELRCELAFPPQHRPYREAFGSGAVGASAADPRERRGRGRPRSRINALSASKGYPFQSAELRKRLYGAPSQFQELSDGEAWGRRWGPRKGFNSSWFSDDELRLVAEWKRQVQRATDQEGLEPIPDANDTADPPEPLSPASDEVPAAPNPSDPSNGIAPVSSSLSKDSKPLGSATPAPSTCGCRCVRAPGASSWVALVFSALCFLGWRRR